MSQDHSELLGRLRKWVPPRCDKGNDHNQESIQSICTDNSCKLNFAPICHLCLEDRTHSSNDFHKYRHLKRCLKLLIDPTSDNSGDQGEDQLTKFTKKLQNMKIDLQKQSEQCIELAESIENYLKKQENETIENTNHDSVCQIVENIVNTQDLNDVRVNLSKLKHYCEIDNNGNPTVKLPDPIKSMKKAPVDYSVAIDIEANIFKVREYIEECQSLVNIYLLGKKGTPYMAKTQRSFSISRPQSRPSSNRRTRSKQQSIHQTEIQKSAPAEKIMKPVSNNYTSSFNTTYTASKVSTTSSAAKSKSKKSTTKEMEERIAALQAEAVSQFNYKQKLEQNKPKARILTHGSNLLQTQTKTIQEPIKVQQEPPAYTPPPAQPAYQSVKPVVQPEPEQPKYQSVQKEPVYTPPPPQPAYTPPPQPAYTPPPQPAYTPPPQQPVVQKQQQSNPVSPIKPRHQEPVQTSPVKPVQRPVEQVPVQPIIKPQPPVQPVIAKPLQPQAQPIKSAVSNTAERKKHIKYINYGARQVLALIDRQLRNGKYTFSINIKANKSMFVGIGIVNSLTMTGSKSNFESELIQQFHGAYLLTSNKVYNSHDPEMNNKFNNYLKFGNNDVITCEYNTVLQKMIFEVKGNATKFEMPFQTTGSEIYYPCVVKQTDNVCKIQDDYDPDWLYL